MFQIQLTVHSICSCCWHCSGHLQYCLLHQLIHPLLILDGSFCCHHLPGKKVWNLVHFFIQILFRNIWISIQNIFKMCMDVHVFLIQYMRNLFGSCTDMRIMYGLTMTFLLLLRLADLWVLFVFLLIGFGVWSFCSASPCLNSLSLSNCWHMAHRVPSLPIRTFSSASYAMKSFRAGKKEKIYIEKSN